MTQDDILALIRSGALRMVIRNAVFQGKNQPGITLSGDPVVFTSEFSQAFGQYQFEFFKMLKRSDVRVCIAPEEHSVLYCFRVDTYGKVRMCPLCESRREEEAHSLPPVEDCVQFKNMRPMIGHDNLV